MGNAWMGAMTDVTYDIWMDGMDDAHMGAMTGITHDVWTDGMDDAGTGAMTHITYDVWTASNLLHYSPHDYRGFPTGFQQTVTRGQTDCLTD